MGAKNSNLLLEHSKAKVDLYSRYLAIYLNIIKRTPFIEKIKLFDLFAGEGVYEKGDYGSSISALKVIKDHYFSNNNSCTNIDILFNDNGDSIVEPTKTKIQRIKEQASKIFLPENVNIQFEEIPFSQLITNIHTRLSLIKNSERALLFIDPWGYKEIKPIDLKNLLSNRKSEIILFLPISHMHRFLKKSLSEDEFPGGKPLLKFLNDLSIFEADLSKRQINFIELLKAKFTEALDVLYVDTFTIEKSKGDYFCLFFFTNNQTGFKAMLKAKWDIDEKRGKGFRFNELSSQSTMFEDTEISNYDKVLLSFIASKNYVTNKEIHDFGLKNGYLPTHSNEILKSLKEQNKIEIITLDEKAAKSFYIENKNRIVGIKIK